MVVICFRSLNYLWLIPTLSVNSAGGNTLWFAFVLWIIFDWYQHVFYAFGKANSCDLLSFFELSLIDTNLNVANRWGACVVICFRSLNYLWLIPTNLFALTLTLRLWFAFVLWIIFDWYQLVDEDWKHVNSCDLLSFFELSLIDTN